MNEFDMVMILLTLMICVAATLIWTFWRLIKCNGQPSMEETRSIALGIGLGMLLGIIGGITLGWMILDNIPLGISLGAGGGLSLGLGITNIPYFR